MIWSVHAKIIFPMCSRYTYTKDEAKLRLRDLIVVFGAVPRANIRPTDLGPVILPEHDGFACRELRWGWGVPWDKSPLINAKSETLGTLATFRPHLHQRCLLLADGFYEKGVLFRQPGGAGILSGRTLARGIGRQKIYHAHHVAERVGVAVSSPDAIDLEAGAV